MFTSCSWAETRVFLKERAGNQKDSALWWRKASVKLQHKHVSLLPKCDVKPPQMFELSRTSPWRSLWGHKPWWMVFNPDTLNRSCSSFIFIQTDPQHPTWGGPPQLWAGPRWFHAFLKGRMISDEGEAEEVSQQLPSTAAFSVIGSSPAPRVLVILLFQRPFQALLLLIQQPGSGPSSSVCSSLNTRCSGATPAIFERLVRSR